MKKDIDAIYRKLYGQEELRNLTPKRLRHWISKHGLWTKHFPQQFKPVSETFCYIDIVGAVSRT